MRHEPIAYAYDAAVHCPECAKRHNMDRDGAKDREGNPVGAIFQWDEIEEGECCDDCLLLIQQ